MAGHVPYNKSLPATDAYRREWDRLFHAAVEQLRKRGHPAEDVDYVKGDGSFVLKKRPRRKRK